MTDRGIVKALECCISPECENCPYDGDDLLRPCNHNLMKDALALINRQQVAFENSIKATKHWHREAELNAKEIIKLQAEIERLKAENEKAKTYLANCFDKYEKTKIAKDSLENTLYTARAEAVKAFAERLKNSLKGYGGLYCQTTMNVKIDNLVKEMVGEQE